MKIDPNGTFISENYPSNEQFISENWFKWIIHQRKMIQMNNLSEKIDPKGTIYLKNDSNVTVYQWKIMQMNISLLKIDPNEQFSSENWST